MAERFPITLNGRSVEAESGWTLSAVLARAGLDATRRSVAGEPRGPLCGMGICYECLVEVDGQTMIRACQIYCRPNMVVKVDVRAR